MSTLNDNQELKTSSSDRLVNAASLPLSNRVSQTLMGRRHSVDSNIGRSRPPTFVRTYREVKWKRVSKPAKLRQMPRPSSAGNLIQSAADPGDGNESREYINGTHIIRQRVPIFMTTADPPDMSGRRFSAGDLILVSGQRLAPNGKCLVIRDSKLGSNDDYSSSSSASSSSEDVTSSQFCGEGRRGRKDREDNLDFSLIDEDDEDDLSDEGSEEDEKEFDDDGKHVATSLRDEAAPTDMTSIPLQVSSNIQIPTKQLPEFSKVLDLRRLALENSSQRLVVAPNPQPETTLSVTTPRQRLIPVAGQLALLKNAGAATEVQNQSGLVVVCTQPGIVPVTAVHPLAGQPTVATVNQPFAGVNVTQTAVIPTAESAFIVPSSQLDKPPVLIQSAAVSAKALTPVPPNPAHLPVGYVVAHPAGVLSSVHPAVVPASVRPTVASTAVHPAAVPASVHTGVLPASVHPAVVPASVNTGVVPASVHSAVVPTLVHAAVVPASLHTGMVAASIHPTVSVPPSSLPAVVHLPVQSAGTPVSANEHAPVIPDVIQTFDELAALVTTVLSTSPDSQQTHSKTNQADHTHDAIPNDPHIAQPSHLHPTPDGHVEVPRAESPIDSSWVMTSTKIADANVYVSCCRSPNCKSSSRSAHWVSPRNVDGTIPINFDEAKALRVELISVPTTEGSEPLQFQKVSYSSGYIVSSAQWVAPTEVKESPVTDESVSSVDAIGEQTDLNQATAAHINPADVVPSSVSSELTSSVPGTTSTVPSETVSTLPSGATSSIIPGLKAIIPSGVTSTESSEGKSTLPSGEISNVLPELTSTDSSKAILTKPSEMNSKEPSVETSVVSSATLTVSSSQVTPDGASDVTSIILSGLTRTSSPVKRIREPIPETAILNTSAADRTLSSEYSLHTPNPEDSTIAQPAKDGHRCLVHSVNITAPVPDSGIHDTSQPVAKGRFTVERVLEEPSITTHNPDMNGTTRQQSLAASLDRLDTIEKCLCGLLDKTLSARKTLSLVFDVSSPSRQSSWELVVTKADCQMKIRKVKSWSGHVKSVPSEQDLGDMQNSSCKDIHTCPSELSAPLIGDIDSNVSHNANSAELPDIGKEKTRPVFSIGEFTSETTFPTGVPQDDTSAAASSMANVYPGNATVVMTATIIPISGAYTFLPPPYTITESALPNPDIRSETVQACVSLEQVQVQSDSLTSGMEQTRVQSESHINDVKPTRIQSDSQISEANQNLVQSDSLTNGAEQTHVQSDSQTNDVTNYAAGSPLPEQQQTDALIATEHSSSKQIRVRTTSENEVTFGMDNDALLEMILRCLVETEEALNLDNGQGGGSTVAIDNKIEQAMDLVKRHLMYAVREEVEILKQQIGEMLERIGQLEYENTVLRSEAKPETLNKLLQPRVTQPTQVALPTQPTPGVVASTQQQPATAAPQAQQAPVSQVGQPPSTT